MALVDFQERQLTLKLVYYGPPRSGKTTNIERLYASTSVANRGRLLTLETENDRTLFFDLLPIFFRLSNVSVRIKLYTVPGQPLHQMTRRVVLRQVDGVAFIADSDPESAMANERAFTELLDNLKRVDIDRSKVALVTQYNKRDLSRLCVPRSLVGEPVLTATATQGEGVTDTFLTLAASAWERLDAELGLCERLSLDSPGFRDALAQHVGIKGQS